MRELIGGIMLRPRIGACGILGACSTLSSVIKMP